MSKFDAVPVISFPLDCFAAFQEVVSDYSPNLEFTGGSPLVLDIGANVGAFALLAKIRWPNARFVCYEPDPLTFAFLDTNVGWFAKTHCAAVVNTSWPVILERGAETRLCSSVKVLYDANSKSETVEIGTMLASELPQADIVKIDTEGSETGIVGGLIDKLPKLLMVEYHSEAARVGITSLLTGKMTLVGHKFDAPNLGVLHYLKD